MCHLQQTACFSSEIVIIILSECIVTKYNLICNLTIWNQSNGIIIILVGCCGINITLFTKSDCFMLIHGINYLHIKFHPIWLSSSKTHTNILIYFTWWEITIDYVPKLSLRTEPFHQTHFFSARYRKTKTQTVPLTKKINIYNTLEPLLFRVAEKI